MAGDGNGKRDIFRKDVTGGAIIRCSTDSGGGEANDSSHAPSISADGRYVAFVSKASNLVAGDGNGVEDVFVKDLSDGTIIRCSTDSGGAEADGSSLYPSISADGRYVAFESSASNLVAGDGNDCADVFRKDISSGAVALCSADF